MTPSLKSTENLYKDKIKIFEITNKFIGTSVDKRRIFSKTQAIKPIIGLL